MRGVLFPRASLMWAVFSSLRRCRAFLHAWGRASRVQFDADKGSFRIPSRVQLLETISNY
eukprot:9139226-Pyramimonas_sp.AAC.1